MKTPKKTVLIVSVTDLHGRYLSTSSLDREVKPLGLDRLQTYLEAKRSAGYDVLLIDNGDSIQGDPVVDLHDFSGPLAHPMNHCHQQLGFDAFILGNHEFNFGYNKLKILESQTQVPWLSANVRHAADNSPAFGQSKVFEKGGMKIGVVGLITAFVPRWEHRTMIPGLLFEDIVQRGKQEVEALKDQCDFVVVCYHGGFMKDPNSEEMWCHDPLENQAEALLAGVPGIDLLITGHQHRNFVLPPKEGESPWVLQAGSYAKGWSEVEVCRSDDQGRGQITKEPQLIDAGNYPPHPALSEGLWAQVNLVSQQLDTLLGTADPSFLIHDPMRDVWLKKHPMIQWVNQLIAKRTGAPIVCTSLLDSGLPGLPSQVRLKDILKNYFFMDHLCVIEVNGRVFRQALEQVASFFALQEHKDGVPKLTVNAHWRGIRVRSYNYDIFDGIDYTFDLTQPIGERVTELVFEGKEVEDQDLLQIGLTTYRAQGAFYQMFRPEQIIAEFPGSVTELMTEDLKKRGHLKVDCTQNFHVKVPQ